MPCYNKRENNCIPLHSYFSRKRESVVQESEPTPKARIIKGTVGSSQRTLSLAAAQKLLPHIAEQFEQEQQLHGQAAPVTVTRSGKPTLAILSYDYYEALLETLEVLEDPELMAALRESMEEADRGETVSIDVVRKELGLQSRTQIP
jgi:PHD/YefM family antitoxin component YafN of YafNO toxin-antitoxin module